MENLENNKFIAEFMGYELQKDPKERFFGRYKTPITKVWVKENELAFDTDWNSLMNVIEKILEISLELDSMEMYYNITDSIPNIKQAYADVTKFIVWCDEQYENKFATIRLSSYL